MSALPKRENLKRLVELLPERELETAERVLAALVALDRDPVAAAFASAPLDDEEVTQEDKDALAEADQDVTEGRVLSHEGLLRSLDL
jgi:hypothetical protein